MRLEKGKSVLETIAKEFMRYGEILKVHKEELSYDLQPCIVTTRLVRYKGRDYVIIMIKGEVMHIEFANRCGNC